MTFTAIRRFKFLEIFIISLTQIRLFQSITPDTSVAAIALKFSSILTLMPSHAALLASFTLSSIAQSCSSDVG